MRIYLGLPKYQPRGFISLEELEDEICRIANFYQNQVRTKPQPPKGAQNRPQNIGTEQEGEENNNDDKTPKVWGPII